MRKPYNYSMENPFLQYYAQGSHIVEEVTKDGQACRPKEKLTAVDTKTAFHLLSSYKIHSAEYRHVKYIAPNDLDFIYRLVVSRWVRIRMFPPRKT